MTPTFQGEVQLLNWSDTHRGGAKIVLQLADAADLEQFKLMTVKKGKLAGQRLMAVMVEIGDDELPAEPEPMTVKTRWKKSPLMALAIQFCNSPDFYRWAGVTGADEAKTFICRACGIASRKELDVMTEAAALFHAHIRLPFVAHCKKNNHQVATG